MTLAIFAHFNGLASDPAELASLSSLAARLRTLGCRPKLVIGDAAGLAPAAIPFASAFDDVTLHRLDNAGDGADAMRTLLAAEISDAAPRYVVALATLASRNWAPQIAAALDAEYVGNAEQIEAADSGLAVTAPVMGGLLRKRIALTDQAAVLLYGGEALASDAAPADALEGRPAAPALELLDVTLLPDQGGLPLRGAPKVVSGGLGIGSAENWALLEQFAAATNAAVGASRAAVDMGWAPSSRQIGFSGKKVAPDVYVAVGISGAVQHLAGIVGARRIIAINADAEAPIFKIADLAIVGDYKNILEASLQKLSKA